MAEKFKSKHVFYPSLPGKSVSVKLCGEFVTIPESGLSPSNSKEEAELLAMADNPKINITTLDLRKPGKEMDPEKLWAVILDLRAELSQAKKEIEALKAKT